MFGCRVGSRCGYIICHLFALALVCNLQFTANSNKCEVKMRLTCGIVVLVLSALFGSSMAASTDGWMSDNDIATAACRMADVYNRVKFVHTTLYSFHDGIYGESRKLIDNANQLDAVDQNSAASAQEAARKAKQAVDECGSGFRDYNKHLSEYLKALKNDLPELKGKGHDHFEQVYKDCYEFGLYRAHEREISEGIEKNRSSLYTWGTSEQELWNRKKGEVDSILASARNKYSHNFDGVRKRFGDFVSGTIIDSRTVTFNLDKATKELDEAQQLYKKALEKVVQNAVKKCQAGGASAGVDGGAQQPNCEKINEKVNKIMKKREQANLKGTADGVQSESGSKTTAAGSSLATQAVPDSSPVVDITADDIDAELIEAVTGPASSAQKSHVSTKTLLAVVIPCAVLLLGAVVCFALRSRSAVKKDPVAL
ncbi:hypothetical protein, conserved in T. vivax [Trypanosoma vivax Y486]|uniref:Uncharacterized protein n=1 Tax=Trypanosoma vivax (strain Y486) TaxID=1055687 RepID=F9WUV5_TRYVY|nr:hypothetical protein, conserved in T. vivax [Trypanosoma vivax Y486]|eukprot:CCD21354.1 hypothetical protein, conserved in T. vivax [Trypanosoma vivax Y486]